MPNRSTCQTTMIGSMPHGSAEAALTALSAYALTIPAWPQLPQRSFVEGMILQSSEGFPGVRIDPVRHKVWVQRDDGLPEAMAAFYENVLTDKDEAMAMSEDGSPGLHAFLRQLEHATDLPSAVKGQITGPLTFALGLADQERRAVWFDEEYRDVVLKGLAMKARWQVGQLKRHAEHVLLFLDEPILSALGTPAYMGIDATQVSDALKEVIRAAQAAGAMVGVHCCGNMDWELLAGTGLDIMAFDAYAYGEKVALYPEAIQGFLERGGTLAYGLIPTSDPEDILRETPKSLVERLRTLQELLVRKGIGEDLVYRRLLLTPACGMGMMSILQSEHVLELLAETRAWAEAEYTSPGGLFDSTKGSVNKA